MLLYFLLQTSNQSSNELQTLTVGNSGKALFEEVASLCERSGFVVVVAFVFLVSVLLLLVVAMWSRL